MIRIFTRIKFWRVLELELLVCILSLILLCISITNLKIIPVLRKHQNTSSLEKCWLEIRGSDKCIRKTAKRIFCNIRFKRVYAHGMIYCDRVICSLENSSKFPEIWWAPQIQNVKQILQGKSKWKRLKTIKSFLNKLDWDEAKYVQLSNLKS